LQKKTKKETSGDIRRLWELLAINWHSNDGSPLLVGHFQSSPARETDVPAASVDIANAKINGATRIVFDRI
jgi:hypothetical protein